MTNDNFEWAGTAASKMLSAGLRRASEERGLSIRQLGKLLNYKQAVVLSHMASGRTPIPIDRAEEIAAVLELNATSFLKAVVEQRHPTVTWSLLRGAQEADQRDKLVDELEGILGAALSSLSAEQRFVLREVVGDAKPRRRWLTVHELPVTASIRALRPSVVDDGLRKDDWEAIRLALQGTPLE